MSDDATSLLGVFDEAATRLSRRLEGLSDAEYLWEPVPGCWSIRRDATGTWSLDGDHVAHELAPLTTIAWRMYHLGGHVLAGFADWVIDGTSPFGTASHVPATATEATTLLKDQYARWRAGVAHFAPSRLREPIGEAFGPYGEASAYDLMLHVLDEYVHHGAEISLLRDLYPRLAHR